MMRSAWLRATDGIGQTVLLRGEAGIGKSRLIGAGRDLVAEYPHEEFLLECSPYHANSAFYPVVQMLERRLGLDEDSSPAASVEAIEELVTARGLRPDDAVPLLASLCDVPVGGRYEQVELNPAMHRYQTLSVLTDLLLGPVDGGPPSIVVMEDLHWADPSTLELLTSLVARQADHPVFVLASTRPDLPELWSADENRQDYPVEALPSSDTRALVEGVLEGKTLPEEVLEEIVVRTGGIPLFIEAVTRTVIDAGVLVERDGGYELKGALPKELIPATVHDSLMARIDKLGEHKGVAQLAATIGRVFGQQLLLVLSGRSSQELERALKHVMDLDLVSRSGFFPDWSYTFKHALLRDAAYESLLRKTRQEYHGRIAAALRDRFPEIAQEQPELLARHFEEAGLVDDAVDYLHRAGQRAMERGAHVEAMAAFGKAIGLLEGEDENPDRQRQELALRASMGGSLVATKGYCAPEFEANAVRSREICDSLGTPPELAPVLYNLWVLNLAASRREPTERFAQELLDFVHTLPEGTAHVSAWFAHGCTLLYRGRFKEARASFDRSLQHWSPDMHAELVRIYGDDHGLFAMVYLQWIHVFEGKPKKALDMVRRTLRLAEEFADPLAEVLTLTFAMIVHHDLRMPDETRRFADRTITLAGQQGFPFWRSNGLIGRGLLRVQA
ncbi:MAG: AAA family ATPase, partial [Gemmatimonadota bacterium]|nr:AAA family ATPase [Gemmatimonadota bacterium]